MPEYRYYTKDLVTGSYIGDVEMFGVWVTRYLNQAGQFNGSYRLGKTAIEDSIALSSTLPGRTALYVDRDGVTIWGGILWSRSYESQAMTMQCYAQTFESYFDHMVFFVNHFIQQGVNQETIFANMVSQLQSQPDANIGLVMGSLPTTNIPRTVLIPNYEYRFATEVIQQLIGVQLGMELTIDPDKTVRLGYPTLGNASATTTYDYPGQIKDYWLPESGAAGAVKFAALGAGSGNQVIRAQTIRQDLLDAGYPGWWQVNSYSDIGDVSIVRDKNLADAQMFGIPYKTPTFELKADEGVGFTSWNNLGDAFKVHIEDVRFPNGQDVVTRLMGWELTPASSESLEIVKFAIDGSDM